MFLRGWDERRDGECAGPLASGWRPRIVMGWLAKRATPIVSSLDLDLYSFFSPATGPGHRKWRHHGLLRLLRQVTARHK